MRSITVFIFSARYNIYISRLCHDASLSVHLSLWGSMEKVVIVAISLILLIFFIDEPGRKCIISEDGTTNYHIGLKRRHIVCILPTYKTRNRICVTDVRKVSYGKMRTA